MKKIKTNSKKNNPNVDLPEVYDYLNYTQMVAPLRELAVITSQWPLCVKDYGVKMERDGKSKVVVTMDITVTNFRDDVSISDIVSYPFGIERMYDKMFKDHNPFEYLKKELGITEEETRKGKKSEPLTKAFYLLNANKSDMCKELDVIISAIKDDSAMAKNITFSIKPKGLILSYDLR